jgi:hypothetical protein
MSELRRFRIIHDPLSGELLDAAVEAAMQGLGPVFDEARVGPERQLTYRTIARELLAALAGHLARAELELFLPEQLSDEDIRGIVETTAASIEEVYVGLVATTVDGFRKTVQAGVECEPPRWVS